MMMGAPPAGRRQKRVRRRGQALSEINVTPLVDVMLVLLIVFMVTAPLLTVGVPIELPRSAAQSLDAQAEPITVSIVDDGLVYIQDQPIDGREIAGKLIAIARNDLDVQIYIRADRATAYGDIMRVMGRINAAGFSRLGLVTLEEQS